MTGTGGAAGVTGSGGVCVTGTGCAAGVTGSGAAGVTGSGGGTGSGDAVDVDVS